MNQHQGNPAQGNPAQGNLAQGRAKIEAMKRQFEQKRAIAQSLSSIKYKIGVYSGKGGVGKTTVAVNLAVALAEQGFKVGLLDVDIDCPNVVKVLDISDVPASTNENRMVPPSRFGVKVMSMAFFQKDENEAIIWRGPMIHNAINTFLQNTEWGELDYLIVDLPPGTSDAPLTVMQALEMDGFVIVTTPQLLAKIDAKRSINMVRKLQIPILGVVENFSGDVFGSGAGIELSKEMDIKFFGKTSLRSEYKDTSRPALMLNPEILQEYNTILTGMFESIKLLP
jgi:ATP-binding protein involved in chromosome partitioning